MWARDPWSAQDMSTYHNLCSPVTHPSPRLLKHTHPPPPLADSLWALIDNRSSKSPPLWNCSVFIGTMADIIVFVKASLNLHFYCFWCCCTSIVQLPLVIWSPLCTTTPILWKFLFSRGRKLLRNWTKFCQFASAVTQCSHWLSWTSVWLNKEVCDEISPRRCTIPRQDVPSPSWMYHPLPRCTILPEAKKPG